MTTKSHTFDQPGDTDETINYDAAVEEFYESLYRFAFGLAGNPADAADLTQDTFRVLLLKSGQLRDTTKLKSWLFTTLYRRFLARRRHCRRFPEANLDDVHAELPAIDADAAEHLDAGIAMSALQTLEDKFRAPLVMFYLEQLSYKEIAEILEVPIGTVMSRLSRGKQFLRTRLEQRGRKAEVIQEKKAGRTVCPEHRAIVRSELPAGGLGTFFNRQVSVSV